MIYRSAFHKLGRVLISNGHIEVRVDVWVGIVEHRTGIDEFLVAATSSSIRRSGGSVVGSTR